MLRSGFLAVSVISVVVLSATAAEAEIRIGVAGPMTGPIAWFGEQYLRATGMAVENLNAEGGVLGQKLELVVGDDFCDPDQAVAVARKLASDGVALVIGHFCSHSSIPASKVYAETGILQIAPGSASAQLTDQGSRNVFRVCGRDDRQGTKIGLPRRALGRSGDRDPGRRDHLGEGRRRRSETQVAGAWGAGRHG
jgi:branched-chain amino acid transport system substrate-binding protein